MSSILMKLQYLDFPECSKEALSYLVRHFSSTQQGIPGLSAGNENFASEVAQEYILNISRKCGPNIKVQVSYKIRILRICPHQFCKSQTASISSHALAKGG